MNEITFTSITPIFNLELESSNSELSHDGDFKDAKYSISLKKYQEGEAGFERLIKYTDENPQSFDSFIKCVEDAPSRKLLSIYLSGYYHVTNYFLVIDVTQPFTGERNLFGGGSPESICITQVVLDALRLHSSKGLLCYQTRWFRSPLHPAYPNTQSVTAPTTNPLPISHLGREKSVLSDSEFTSCQSTINSLINKKGSVNGTFDKVLALALAYHRIVFSLEAIEHAFLILMVIFEALFKEENDKNATKAAKMISQLLSNTKKEAKHIRIKFCDGNDSFTDIRNAIAHGDSNLDPKNVNAKYPDLYSYVTKTIIKLIRIPDAELDNTKDYYKEITKYIDQQFNLLPDS